MNNSERSIILNGRALHYELVRKSVKNVNLRIKPDGKVCVSASRAVPVAYVEDFMRSKADFIIRALDACESRVQRTSERRFVDGETVCVFGAPLVLSVSAGAENKARIDGGLILLSVKDPDDTELKRKTLTSFLDKLCKEEILSLCASVYPHFERLGVEFPQIRFRRMTSRWGSCIPKKRALTFNLRLVHATMDAIEYVVYHEFTHFLHPDHSKAFHARLSSFLPDADKRKKELNRLETT